MKHFQNYSACGDIIAPVQMQNVNGKPLAKTRIGFQEYRKGQNGGQGSYHMVSQSVQAWGDTATLLASIPQGHTVMISGKPENYKYKDQQGNERWGSRITLFSVGNCGPSKYNQPQQQGQNSYSQPQGQPQSHGHQGATGYPPQNNAGGGYPPQQQQAQSNQVPGFDPNEQIPF